MNTQDAPHEIESPFHSGEQQMQSRVGKRDAMEAFGSKVIRPFMPDQHREFFSQLPFLVMGRVDQQGWPWVSLISAEPGFTTSPDAKTLTVDVVPNQHDPVLDGLSAGEPVALLGIELTSRRRNRMNGRIKEQTRQSFSIAVDQSFGNCPQYIHKRGLTYIGSRERHESVASAKSHSSLSAEMTALISDADTFFVSSFVQSANQPSIEGVDVSHRGGRPGFVNVEGNQLTVPDFPGNYHFNTLGNFLLNPKAGLAFANFETGDVLQLTGSVELFDEVEATTDTPLDNFIGAERGWRFELKDAQWLRGNLPFRFTKGEDSPNNALTDDWITARARAEVKAQKAQGAEHYQPYRVTRIVNESSVIKSFYLEPVDGTPVAHYEAGQHLPIRLTPVDRAESLTRTYTLSSAPADAAYRISVKREAQNKSASVYLHDQVKVGDVIDAKTPRGSFFINPDAQRPALLFAGGVGVTPMMSMARHVANEGVRTRKRRQLTIFHAAATEKERAFYNGFRDLSATSEGHIRYFTLARELEGDSADFTGHLNADILQATLPIADYDCYLCGPADFMQSVYDLLRSMGIADHRIFAEAFGPSALKRISDNGEQTFTPAEEADSARVHFTKSGLDIAWSTGDGTLLEVAEELGLTPGYGCRGGSCGSCITKIQSGTAVNRNPATADHASDEVLICSAVPGKGCTALELDL